MKSATIRIIVILSLLFGGGIIVTQIYWLKRAFDLNEKTFNLKAHAALHQVADNVMETYHIQPGNYSVITQLKPEYYVVQTNVFVDKDVLKHFLATAFTSQDILTDFEYALYDCGSDQVKYSDYYHMPGSGEQPNNKEPKMPLVHRENYYFSVYFPHRKQYLLSSSAIWIASSIALLGVLVFLVYLLFIIFKQKRLSEVQKDFVNNMTHEFKTPLSAIQLSADVLKNPSIVHQPQRLLNYATIISNESNQLASHVERMLQMARAEQKGIHLHEEEFIWQDLVGEAKEQFLQLSGGRNKRAEILLQLPDEPVAGFGDKMHLKNMIGNLLDNAVSYCDQEPVVTISLMQTTQTLSVVVADNGIGIDRQHQKLLFEKFYRVPTGNVHNAKGFGLGLNYVQLIARAHNGDVSCVSDMGKGSTFTLSFPYKKPLDYERQKGKYSFSGG